MGVRLMGVVFMFLITAGQVVTALGASMEDQQSAWYVMWAGRTLFGLGGESLSVVQSAFVARYFQGKELALALGVNLALARVGSVINDVVSAVIANNAAFYWSYWAGAAVCGASLLAMVAAYYVDLAADNRLRAVKGLPPLAGQGLLRRLVGLFCGCCWRRRQPQRRGSSGRPSGDEDDEVALAALGGKGADGEGEGPTEEIHMSAVLRFPLTFWILCGSCLTVYICVLTFNNNAAAFIAQVGGCGVGGVSGLGCRLCVQGSRAAGQGAGSAPERRRCRVGLRFSSPPPSHPHPDGVPQKYLADAPLSQLTDDQKNPMFLTANSIMLTTYLVSGFLTPFLGGVIDNVGLRAIFCAVAAVIITGLHAVMALTTLYPVAPLVLLGVCYSIYAAALWPSIALVIDPANQVRRRGWDGAYCRPREGRRHTAPSRHQRSPPPPLPAPGRRRRRTAS